jgi:hypothetical protein
MHRAVVPVVQAVDLWNHNDAPDSYRDHWPWSRRVLLESQMGPRAHVVRDVGGDYPLQSCGVQHEHVVKALTPDRSDESLDVGALPW